jgi:hypothetical protein
MHLQGERNKEAHKKRAKRQKDEKTKKEGKISENETATGRREETRLGRVVEIGRTHFFCYSGM